MEKHVGDLKIQHWKNFRFILKLGFNYIKPLYVKLIITLETIQQNLNFKPDVRAKAKVYLESFCKYETIITAKTFLRIFDITKPLFKYLQTSGLDILKDFHMVSQTFSELKKLVRDFDAVQKVANDFIVCANEESNKCEDSEI